MRRAYWFAFCLFLLPLLTPSALLAAPETSTEDPKKVEGAPYDENAITVLPGSPKVISERGTAGPGQALPPVQTYSQLIDAVRGARIASRARVQQSVERELVREAWEIGQLIDAHVLQHKERADYGEKVLKRLSDDLGMSHTELKYMLQFYRAYPIRPPADQLSWAHFRELLSVNDSQERQAVAEQAVKEKWTRDKTREEIKKHKALKGTGAPGEFGATVLFEEKPLPLPTLGKPGIYKIVTAKSGPEAGKVVIDLGFSNYYRTSKDLSFKPGELIETLQTFPESSSPSDKIRLLRPPTGGNRQQESSGLQSEVSSLLYTYRAWVVRVLDGDTIAVVVDLGFGVRSVQTLRLRGIDCPELVSKEGQEAKEFVEELFEKAGGVRRPATGEELSRDAVLRTPYSVEVLIKTTKSDKYDRYLADVFIPARSLKASAGGPGATENQDIPEKNGGNLYLNNELLQKGLAARARQ